MKRGGGALFQARAGLQPSFAIHDLPLPGIFFRISIPQPRRIPGIPAFPAAATESPTERPSPQKLILINEMESGELPY